MVLINSGLTHRSSLVSAGLVLSWIFFKTIIGVTTQQQQQQLRLSTNSVLTSKTQSSGNEQQTYDTSNLIFASFLGLLQQWPNSFAYSGHSIITGTIPPSTLLYHSRPEAEPPQGMEWLAFDPELSYQFHSLMGGKTKLFTYVSERPLRIIYIDGQSASLSTPGFMDSQSVLIDGKVEEEWQEGNKLAEEYKRAHNLCAIGEEWGFEGVVRMNTGFELIWCDFKEGIKLVDKLDFSDDDSVQSTQLISWSNSSLSHRQDHPVYYFSVLMWIQSASWHNYAPGEARVKLDPSGFVSFYDRIDSLAEKRRVDGTENSDRSSHRLFGISDEDVEKVRQRLIRALKRKNEGRVTDQVDWTTIALTISQRYGSRLQKLSDVLNRRTLNVSETSLQVRRMTYAMMMPYVNFSKSKGNDSGWLEPSISKCTTAYTHDLSVEDDDTAESIQTIRKAIEGTLNRICKTVAGMFSETLAINLSASEGFHSLKIERLAKDKLKGWRTEIDGLIQWLGWYLKRCDPECLADEICLPPMWPLTRSRLNSTYLSNFPICSYLTPNATEIRPKEIL
ncbi:hypothetical protein BY996DRAFT_7553135 [Phakopsora pachyrhizi]|uniref:Uncharacterized protein n=1 Tax=Phakopsora pachyrhizi TaxID=170000 RepID=A0AAV0AWV0_PHAPC|nr:hypothetical protein BY996DRAFT_7553135 [Phakopsora pachyrhizi]CAH7674735.1 hypothetical protein PPACK8108_LOCUS9667 [Phakopsora pachyrhizi]